MKLPGKIPFIEILIYSTTYCKFFIIFLLKLLCIINFIRVKECFKKLNDQRNLFEKNVQCIDMDVICEFAISLYTKNETKFLFIFGQTNS